MARKFRLSTHRKNEFRKKRAAKELATKVVPVTPGDQEGESTVPPTLCSLKQGVQTLLPKGMHSLKYCV